MKLNNLSRCKLPFLAKIN